MSRTTIYSNEAMEELLALPNKTRLNLLVKVLTTSYRWPNSVVKVDYLPDGDYGLAVKQNGKLKIYICAVITGEEVSLHS